MKIKKNLNTVLMGVLIALAVVSGLAFAASDPPQVGETSRFLLKASGSSLTWTASALKDGTAYTNFTTVFTNQSAFAFGQYEARHNWTRPGEYVVKFTPSQGNTVIYTVSVVSNPQQASPFTIATSIDAQLAAKHGAGSWRTATILPFQGAASYETVQQGRDVHVVKGDSAAIPYTIGKDITGWTVWLGAKANPADADYAVSLREVTADVTDASAGSGLIKLSAPDTAVPPRRYYAELKIKKGSEVNTVLKFFLWIDPGVIN